MTGTQRPSAAEAHGIECIGYHDLGGHPAFKTAMQEVNGRWFLYLSNFWRSGWSVLDVTEPESPVLLSNVPGPSETWTLQVQVADGLMVTSLERPPAGWGFDPSRTEATGLMIWDVAGDPGAPQLLSHYETGGRGTHRNFYGGGRYAYLAASLEGFHEKILLVLDLDDPTAPREVGRWWWPGQWLGGGERPEFAKYLHGPPYVRDNYAYLSYGHVGMVILDVSDPAKPELVSRLSFGDFGSSIGCHSVVPYGDGIVVANSEAIEEGEAGWLDFAVTVDVSDPAKPVLAGWLPTPRISASQPFESYTEKGGRFGPHNQHHHQGQDCLLFEPHTVHLTYFNAGLRIYDISDPRSPFERAYFVPADPAERRGPLPVTRLVTQTEDVIVDRRGFIYCTDKNHGLFILRETRQ